MAQCNDKELTIQTPNRERAKNDVGGKEDDSTSGGRPSSRYNRGLQQGTRMYQTRATPHGRKKQDQVDTLHPRDPSLVRRSESPNALPYIKTSSKKIWTFSHQEGSIRCLL